MAKKDSASKRLAERIAHHKLWGVNALASYDADIQRACEAFGLDPQNAFHQRYLLGLLASVCFGTRPKRGRKPGKRWPPDRLDKLFAHLRQLRATPKHYANVAARLKGRWPDDYPKKVSTLKIYLRDGPPGWR